MGRNGSENNGNRLRVLQKDLPVPANHELMVSFQQRTPHRPCVKLFFYNREYDPSTGFFKKIFDRSSFWTSEIVYYFERGDFDGACVYNTTNKNVAVRVSEDTCSSGNIAACFQLFFSFFSRNEAPRKLSSGLWNCSVEDYSSFQHHMECNLKTECEDGRDETEHCPFSSPDCQGMVALCARCYNIFQYQSSFEVDGNKLGNQHCNQLGGVLKFPTCVHDPYNMIVKQSKIYWHIPSLHYVGLYFKDQSLPNMYRRSVHRAKTIFLHSFGFIFPYYDFSYEQEPFCIRLQLKVMKLRLSHCTSASPDLVCEFKTNKTEGSRQTKGISLVTQLLLPANRHYMTEQPDGHLTFTFLLTGSMFACTNRQTVSYNLVCDFIADCVDSSDEFFCQHPPCMNTFTCKDGRCQPYEHICDQLSHCHDESEEQDCQFLKPFRIHHKRFPSPALISFNGLSQFVSTPMNSNDSCPDSHYRCPGEFNDCLPVFTRCNGIFDCMEHQDEEECWETKCPGLFRCRLSKVCLHSDHMCDGWPHCPKHDDELWCDMTCPVGCLCQGHTFLCRQRFHAELFPLIRSLNASGSGMTPAEVSSRVYLVHLILVNCSLTRLPEMKWQNLRFLDLSHNKLQNINVTSFLLVENLRSLSLSNNPITSIYDDSSSANQESVLTELDLSYTTLAVFDPIVLTQFVRLQKLNLSYTSIHTIGTSFQFIPQLTELYLDGSPVETIPLDIFEHLLFLRVISAQNYKLCCSEVLPYDFDTSFCYAPKNGISSCEDLLPSWMLRGFLWLTVCLAVSGNVFCFCARLCIKRMIFSSGFSVFVTNLTMADFLMGVYMTVIGVADERFRGRYLHHDDSWKSSVACKVSGFLSLLSSEVSALIICLITADRFIVLAFPFSTLHFQKTSAAVVCILTWLIGFFLAVLPLLPMTSHWQFYSQTGICIPLPVTRRKFKGKVYSFSILIVLNFVLFLLISMGQAFVYWSIQKNALKVSSTKVSQDITIARRLISIALTDFLCWFPIGLCGMLALAGFPIPGEMNVALAIFILPLNSAVNPFIYTFNTLAEKWRKSKEISFLKWIESHPDAIPTY